MSKARKTLNLTERKARLTELITDAKTKCFSPALLKDYQAQLIRVTEQLEVEKADAKARRKAEKERADKEEEQEEEPESKEGDELTGESSLNSPEETGVNNLNSEARQNG